MRSAKPGQHGSGHIEPFTGKQRLCARIGEDQQQDVALGLRQRAEVANQQ